MKRNTDIANGTVLSQSFGAYTVQQMNETIRDFLLSVQLTEHGNRIYDLQIQSIANFSVSNQNHYYYSCIIFFTLNLIEIP